MIEKFFDDFVNGKPERIRYLKWGFILTALCVILLFVVPNASATITVNETTDTSIYWSWDDNYYKDIYFDGKFQEINNVSYFIASDLQPNTKHRLTIINITDGIVQTSIAKTTLFQDMYTIGAALIVCIIIGVFIPIAAALAVGVSLYGITISANTNQWWFGWMFVIALLISVYLFVRRKE